MILTALILLAEGVLCNLLLSPDANTNADNVAVLLLIINIAVVSFGISYSLGKTAKPDSDKVKHIVIGSFILRIAVLLWDVYARNIYILPNSEGDAEWYHIIGERYAFGSLANEVNLNRYSYYVGLLYKFIGSQKLTAQFLNVFLAICSIIIIYKILCLLNIDSDIRVRTMLVAAFLPNLIMITTFMLQESVIAFLSISSFYYFIRWWNGRNYVNILFALILSAAASVLHMGGLIVGLGALVSIFLVNKDRKLAITPLRIGLMIVAGFVGVYLLTTQGDLFLAKLGGDISAESIVENASLKESGGGVYNIGISGLPPSVDLIVNTPIRMVYFIFSPLPWMWRGVNDIIAFVGSTIFYIVVIYFAIKAIRRRPAKAIDDSKLLSVLISLIIILIMATIMFGWGTSNSGTALRHREKFTYLFIVLFAVSQEIIFRVNKQNEKNSIDNSSGLQRRKVSSKMHHFYR